jgi:hypothetical protein
VKLTRPQSAAHSAISKRRFTGRPDSRDWKAHRAAPYSTVRQMRTGADSEGKPCIKITASYHCARDAKSILSATAFNEQELEKSNRCLGNVAHARASTKSESISIVPIRTAGQQFDPVVQR